MDRSYGPEGMQISRHWRLNSQRYGLEGVRYQDGGVSFQNKVLSPTEVKLKDRTFNFMGQVSYLKLADEFIAELSFEAGLSCGQITKMIRVLLKELRADKELSYDALVLNERLNKLTCNELKTQAFIDYLIDTEILFNADGFLSIVQPHMESLIELQES